MLMYPTFVTHACPSCCVCTLMFESLQLIETSTHIVYVQPTRTIQAYSEADLPQYMYTHV